MILAPALDPKTNIIIDILFQSETNYIFHRVELIVMAVKGVPNMGASLHFADIVFRAKKDGNIKIQEFYSA